MKVAAYQAPRLPPGSMAALDLIRKRIDRCESEGVEILCCPEAVLGGLADYAPRPSDVAIDVAAGRLDALLQPLTSDIVTSILGFTELGDTGRLYNAAAVFHRGRVVGVYRKLFPAIRNSVYEAGNETPCVHDWRPDLRYRHLQRLQLCRAGKKDGGARRTSPVHTHEQWAPADKTGRLT
jgi:predicted amidohydrolase